MAVKAIPVVKHQEAYGTQNPNPPATQRAVPKPFEIARGPVQGKEQFVMPNADAAVSRALVQMQANIQSATQQTKSNVFANSNLIRGISLINGGANGASPNFVSHGLGRKADGYLILSPRGGFVTNHALIANANVQEDASTVRVWTQRTLFAGSTAVVADILVFAL